MTRNVCATIINVQTAVVIGKAGANNVKLLGVMVAVALTGTCVIAGFTDEAGAAANFTLPAATPAGFYDFRGAVNAAGSLTVTASNASDDLDIMILWEPL